MYQLSHLACKEGTLLNLVCFEVNLVSVPKHTWWIDSGAKGCSSCRMPSDGERYIYVGDGKLMEVEAIDTFRLLLRIYYFLDLKDTYVIPSFRRNLVSVSILDKFGYYCSFGNGKFSLLQNSNLVAIGSLSSFYNLYLLDTNASFNESLHINTIGVKCKLTNESSASLWHKRLGTSLKGELKGLCPMAFSIPLIF